MAFVGPELSAFAFFHAVQPIALVAHFLGRGVDHNFGTAFTELPRVHVQARNYLHPA